MTLETQSNQRRSEHSQKRSPLWNGENRVDEEKAGGGDQPSPPPITQDQVRIFTVLHGLEKGKRGYIGVSYEPTNQPAVDYAVKECRALLGKGMSILAAKVLWNEHRRHPMGQAANLKRRTKSISQPAENERPDEAEGLSQKAAESSQECRTTDHQRRTGEF